MPPFLAFLIGLIIGIGVTLGLAALAGMRDPHDTGVDTEYL